MIIDEVKIVIAGGKGGDGAVSFRHEKYVDKGGPDGGNGGKGGDVFFDIVSELTALNQFQHKKEVEAEDGHPGARKKKDGKDGKDIILRIPVGTLMENLYNGEKQEFDTIGKRFLIAKGGKGGKGNYELRSSSNTTPLVAEDGRPGEVRDLHLNLRYIAQAGFIGLPNGGKSSLLNSLTNADVKTADYPFTTLEPNLGDMQGFILADIPGLIEGASSGKGLGIRFLKHIEKTFVLVHCIDLQSGDILKDYEIIRKELEQFNPLLTKKREIVILTKSDMVSEKEIKQKEKIIKKVNKEVYICSVLDDAKIKKIAAVLTAAMSK